jgi:hypothetical protein
MTRKTVSFEVTITAHAFDRGKERLGLDRSAFQSLAVKAYIAGKKHAETKGNLKAYISELFLQYKNANNTRVYGENIYIFSNNTLITVYQLPNHLKKLAKK